MKFFACSIIPAAAMTLATANAAIACDATTVRARLAEIERWFHQPRTQEKLAAAKQDLEADGEFDSDDSAFHLGTVAIYHSMKRHLDAGYVDTACEMLTDSKVMVRKILDAP